MPSAHSWAGVLGHLSFVAGDLSGQNGLGRWGSDLATPIKFPFLNLNNMAFKYSTARQEAADSALERRGIQPPARISSGGDALEFEIPGVAYGIPATSVKVYIMGGHPEVGFIVSIEQEISFEALLRKFCFKAMLNPKIYKVLKRFKSDVVGLLDNLCNHAPSFAIAGGIGMSFGTTGDTQRAFIRFLTNFEMSFKPNIFGMHSQGERYAELLNIDSFSLAGSGRSWQISSLANIPRSLH